MKKLVLSLIVCLGLVVASASDLKTGSTVIKDYDKYWINSTTGVCEKTSDGFKSRLMKDLGTGLVTLKNVFSSAAGNMTYLVAEDKTGRVQIFVADTYGECEFGKALLRKVAYEEDAPKYVGLKDPNVR